MSGKSQRGQWGKGGLTAGGDVAAAQGHVAFGTDEVEALEVVAFAEGLLPAIGAVDGKELACDDRVAVLNRMRIR